MGAKKNCMLSEVIVQNAYALFAEKGIYPISLADIASSCQISKGTLYYYYPDRELLVLECAQRCVKCLNDNMISWLEGMSSDMTLRDVYIALSEIFAGESSDIKLLTALLNYNGEQVDELMHRTLSQWNIMLELAALRLNGEDSEKFTVQAPILIYTFIGAANLRAGSEARMDMIDRLLS